MNVTIRPAAAEDCEILAAWLSNPDVNRWLGSEWRAETVDPRRVAFALKDKNVRFFVALADGRPCGLVTLSDLDFGDRIGMVWYLLGEHRLARQGVMTRAVEQAIDHAFRELELLTVFAWIHPDNSHSLRLLERIGFRPAGRLRGATVFNGSRADRLLFDLTEVDWHSRHPRA